MTLSFAPDHADAVLAYEKAMRDRNRLLKDQVTDPHWYAALEAQMADAGAMIFRTDGEAPRAIKHVLQSYCSKPFQSLIDDVVTSTLSSAPTAPATRGDFEVTLTKTLLNRLFQRTFAVAKDVRTRTDIGSASSGPTRAPSSVVRCST